MGILLDILSGIGNTLDVPGSMVRDALGGENPFDQLMAPWRSNNRLSGRDLNRRWGLAGQEDTWGNLAGGIGTELATDPLNIIPGLGLLKRAFQGAKIAKATRAVDAANDASMALRAKGWMPEEVARATKIRGKAYDAYDDTGKLLGSHPTPHAAQGQAWGESERALDSRIVDRDIGPARLYHETAAPVFGSHEFLPDPGTNNWLGKGTYFTKQPGEAAGAYAKWDKSKTILPQEPGAFVPASGPQRIIEAFRRTMPESYFKNITPELERTHLPMIGATALENPQGYPTALIEELRGLYRQNTPGAARRAGFEDFLKNVAPSPAPAARESAPRTMMTFVDSRNPYTFEEPATLKDMLMAARATRVAGPGRELRELARQHGLKVPKMPDEFVSAMRQATNKHNPRSLDGIRKVISDADADLDFVHKMGPDEPTFWVEMSRLEQEKELAEEALQLALHGPKKQLTKGDIWALLRSEGNSPDEITDALRGGGYDALQHEPGTGTKIQERMHDIGREAPDIDEHSELVVFSPSRIYEPFIAPALRARPDQLKKIPRSLKAAFAAYQAGVAPSRGRSQE